MRAGRLHGRSVFHYRRPDRIAALRADLVDETLDEGRIVYHYEGVMRAGKLEGRRAAVAADGSSEERSLGSAAGRRRYAPAAERC